MPNKNNPESRGPRRLKKAFTLAVGGTALAAYGAIETVQEITASQEPGCMWLLIPLGALCFRSGLRAFMGRSPRSVISYRVWHQTSDGKVYYASNQEPEAPPPLPPLDARSAGDVRQGPVSITQVQHWEGESPPEPAPSPAPWTDNLPPDRNEA